MQARLLPSLIIGSLITLTAFQACKKESALGIDNNKVVKIPYSLYAANVAGEIVHTTDGAEFHTVFPPDGFTPSLLLTSGSNLLMLKNNLHLSENEGRNFNMVYDRVAHYPWQSMAIDVPMQDRIYITSTAGRGVAFSDDHGKTWYNDSIWDNDVPAGTIVNSFASLNNNAVFAYDSQNSTLLRKDGPDGQWTEVEIDGTAPSGAALYLVSNSTHLFLIDYGAQGGVWYSDDEGVEWTQFDQGDLPVNTLYHCAVSPAGGRSLVVGTDSAGIYRTVNDRFESASGGLDINSSVYRISGKSNTYKNDVVKSYLYAASDKGIFISEDFGHTWDKITFGVWNKKYIALY